MKKLLFILLFIPLISFGQESEATYKITTKSGEVIKSKNYRINKQKRVVDIQKLNGEFIRLRTDKIVSYELIQSEEELERIAAEQSRLDSIKKVADDLIKKEKEKLNSVFDDWEESEYVDEFGDPSGSKYKFMISTNGVFSNSAANNEKLTGRFLADDESLTIDIFEYGKNRANDTQSTFETVKFKQPNGNIVEIKRVFFTKNGSLYFNKKHFKQIQKTLSLKGDYTMIFNRSGTYSKSRYRLKFSM